LTTRGRFITLEGVEGSGKSTQAVFLAEALRLHGNQVIVTREPGGTHTGELIRAIFLDRNVSLEGTAELLLILADRAQHVREKLRPALAAGQIVISDRYADSTMAYQGYGRGLDLKLVSDLNRLASDGLTPDLTVVLDCPAELGLARTRARAKLTIPVRDRFETEPLEFHRRVCEGFRAIAREAPARVVLVDSSAEAREVAAAVIRLVFGRLGGQP
jgi:dTMP kinase